MPMLSDEFWKVLPQMKGGQLWVASFVIFAIAVLFFARILLVPGASRVASQEKRDERTAHEQEKERRDAISIMQGQIADLRGEVKGLQKEVARMRRAETYDRESRHALANQVQALIGAVEVCRELLNGIADEWPDMPRHFRTRITGLKTPADIIARWPMPPLPEEEDDSPHGTPA